MSIWSDTWHAVTEPVKDVAEKVGGVVADTVSGGAYTAHKQRKELKRQRRKEEEEVRKQRKQALEERKRQIDSQREQLRGNGTSTRGSNKKGIKGTIPEEKLG